MTVLSCFYVDQPFSAGTLILYFFFENIKKTPSKVIFSTAKHCLTVENFYSFFNVSYTWYKSLERTGLHCFTIIPRVQNFFLSRFSSHIATQCSHGFSKTRWVATPKPSWSPPSAPPRSTTTRPSGMAIWAVKIPWEGYKILAKNQHTQRKSLWIKCKNLTSKENFLWQKWSESFLKKNFHKGH